MKGYLAKTDWTLWKLKVLPSCFLLSRCVLVIIIKYWSVANKWYLLLFIVYAFELAMIAHFKILTFSSQIYLLSLVEHSQSYIGRHCILESSYIYMLRCTFLLLLFALFVLPFSHLLLSMQLHRELAFSESFIWLGRLVFVRLLPGLLYI